MRAKKLKQSGFGNTIKMTSAVFRPERQKDINQLERFVDKKGRHILPVGNQMSYGDSCINDRIISTDRLNRFINYDNHSKQVTIEPGVTFMDLLSLEDNIIPPVMPGTLHASIAGGIAHDVHGKNQAIQGCLGEHINWLELALPTQTINVSPNENADLFYATISGLGLTGLIKKVNLSLKPGSHCIKVKKSCFSDIKHGIRKITRKKETFEYQAAWFDPYREGRGILFQGKHLLNASSLNLPYKLSIPLTFPFSLINGWSIQQFNKLYFKAAIKRTNYKQSIIAFNNPLDSIVNWNRLYGPQGFYQFQCVVEHEFACDFIEHAFELIKQHQASPSLAVMKNFDKNGVGLLSFAKPGITFAIDFPAKQNNKACIEALNELLLNYGGRVYLAKDQLLTEPQFKTMYPNYQEFLAVLEKYQINNVFHSALRKRIGL